jgi:hypothetical protein
VDLVPRVGKRPGRREPRPRADIQDPGPRRQSLEQSVDRLDLRMLVREHVVVSLRDRVDG